MDGLCCHAPFVELKWIFRSIRPKIFISWPFKKKDDQSFCESWISRCMKTTISSRLGKNEQWSNSMDLIRLSPNPRLKFRFFGEEVITITGTHGLQLAKNTWERTLGRTVRKRGEFGLRAQIELVFDNLRVLILNLKKKKDWDAASCLFSVVL